MKAKLVHEHDYGRQRFYELSEPINKGVSDWKGPIDDIRAEVVRIIDTKIKEQYRDEMHKAFEDGVHIVCISDAHTHTERLVFPACSVNGEYFGLANDIDGKHTTMLFGGDPRAVYDDEVYLRHLCIINHLEWEGFEK